MSNAPESVLRRNPKDVVAQLRERAQKDPVFNAVCTRFAIRERARAQVTIASLRLTMGREGFHYPTAKYESILSFLASLGIGKLQKENGKIKALVEVKTTLQSIGAAALNSAQSLQAFSPGNTFEPLPLTTSVKPTQKDVTLNKPRLHNAILTVTINDKEIEFPLPRAISSEELGYILSEFYTSGNFPLKGRS